MTDSADNEQEQDGERHCPVCKTRTVTENLDSQGLILNGMKALFEGDEDTINTIYSVLTPYDGHTAIGLAAALVNDMCLMIGVPPEHFIDQYRATLNHAQAHGE